jgi:hypothetical protein
LYLGNNQIASFDGFILPTSLVNLYLNDNQLTSFDGTGLTSLTNLSLENNQLTSFDGTGLTSLTDLNLKYNQLISFDGTDLTSLTILYLNNNQLTSFDGTGLTSLTNLDLSGNQLTSFDGTGLTSLTSLVLVNNLLTSIDVSPMVNLISLFLADVYGLNGNPMTATANNAILAAFVSHIGNTGSEKKYISTTGGRTSAGTADYNTLINDGYNLIGFELATPPPSGNGKLRIKGVNSGGGTTTTTTTTEEPTTTTTTAAPQPLPQYEFVDTMMGMPVSSNQFGFESVVNNLVGGNVVTTVDMNIQELVSTWANDEVFSLVARDANNTVVHQELLLDKKTLISTANGNHYATGTNVTATYSPENLGFVYEFTPTSFTLSSYPLASGEYKLELTTNFVQTSVDTYVRLIVS